MEKPIASMDMVAVLAGVTRTSVYHYFWGKWHTLNPSTRERIKQAVEKLDYEPYGNSDWFKVRGQYILKQRGYDPEALKETLRKGVL